MRTGALMLGGLLLMSAAPALAQDQQPQDATEPTTATARFINVDGEDIGTVTLTQTAGGVVIEGLVEGIPEGEHGFHLHEAGTCDAAGGFESAGGHFNPTGSEHGFENEDGPHAGDMRNQMADANGQMALNVTNAMVSLTAGAQDNPLDDDGSAVMIHSGPDDYLTDPGGDAGDRIACAVIVADDA